MNLRNTSPLINGHVAVLYRDLWRQLFYASASVRCDSQQGAAVALAAWHLPQARADYPYAPPRARQNWHHRLCTLQDKVCACVTLFAFVSTFACKLGHITYKHQARAPGSSKRSAMPCSALQQLICIRLAGLQQADLEFFTVCFSTIRSLAKILPNEPLPAVKTCFARAMPRRQQGLASTVTTLKCETRSATGACSKLSAPAWRQGLTDRWDFGANLQHELLGSECIREESAPCSVSSVLLAARVQRQSFSVGPAERRAARPRPERLPGAKAQPLSAVAASSSPPVLGNRSGRPGPGTARKPRASAHAGKFRRSPELSPRRPPSCCIAPASVTAARQPERLTGMPRCLGPSVEFCLCSNCPDVRPHCAVRRRESARSLLQRLLRFIGSWQGLAGGAVGSWWLQLFPGVQSEALRVRGSSSSRFFSVHSGIAHLPGFLHQ